MKEENKSIIIFENQPVRRVWDGMREKWFFSVIDIVAVLTEQRDFKKAQSYWTTLKNRLKNEGSEVVTKCDRLKLIAKDGKKYLTDVADIETILRLVQSIPSKKAEPFKLWLARVGYERMQETVDPELAVSRGRAAWQALGRSKKWIEQRMLGVETRNKLTDYWTDHGIEKPDEYAALTNVIHREWSGISVKSHKKLKDLKQENLRDHMDEAELIFTALAELSTRQIAESEKAEGYGPNEGAARKGGRVSGNARKELEKRSGKKVVNSGNFLPEESKRINKKNV